MNGPLPYVGGKQRLAKAIISRLPDHVAFVEVFGGGGQVLFHKAPSTTEVLNDIDGELVNFYRVLQWHHDELIRYLRFTLASRGLHQLHVKTDPALLTDVQRAARYYYLRKNSWGGLIVKQTFHYGIAQNSNYNPERIPDIILEAHRRLAHVQIECLPYQEILERYDREQTFFFCDPPYFRRKLYRHNFSDEDFLELAERLSKIKGKFLLTLDDHPEVRSIFSRFRIERTEIVYTAIRKVGKRFGELFITNYIPTTNPANN